MVRLIARIVVSVQVLDVGGFKQVKLLKSKFISTGHGAGSLVRTVVTVFPVEKKVMRVI